MYCEDSSTIDEAASRRHVTLEVLYQFHSEQCGIYGGRSDKEIYFSSEYLNFSLSIFIQRMLQSYSFIVIRGCRVASIRGPQSPSTQE